MNPAAVATHGRQRRVRRTVGLLTIVGGLAMAAALPALASDDRSGELAGSASATVVDPTPDGTPAPAAAPEPSPQDQFAAWYAGLTPEEQARFQLVSMTPEEQASFVAMFTPPAPEPAPEPDPEPAPAPKPKATGTGPANGFLACVRHRESRGNYGAVNRGSGAGGAYQFLQSTWNNVARKAGRGDLVGVHPSQASPADQDAMAATLYAWQGRAPWAGPGC